MATSVNVCLSLYYNFSLQFIYFEYKNTTEYQCFSIATPLLLMPFTWRPWHV